MVNLRIPGPIPVDDEILHAMSSPMINHRGPEFEELLYGVTEGLKKVFSTNTDLYIITGSGTSAMEAAVVNTLSPDDTAINATVGVFGNRFGIIGRNYGVKVVELAFPFGSAVDLNLLRKCLDDNPATKAVMVTHNETSTGVTNDLEAIAKVVKEEYKKLLRKWDNANVRFVISFLVELNSSITHSKTRMIFTHTDIFTWTVLCSPLSNNDITSNS